MSDRIHTTAAEDVLILEYQESELVARFGEEFAGLGHCIVFADDGNGEYWVLSGTAPEIGRVLLQGLQAGNALLDRFIEDNTRPSLSVVPDGD